MPNKESVDNLEIGFSKVIEKHLEKYFALHNGGTIPPGVYERILNEVERSTFKITLKYCNGNQVKASKVLGLNRNTLRKKIIKINSKEGNL